MRSYPAFDQIIEVEFRAFPALWWLAAGFEVRIGERVFHPQLDRLVFFGHPFTEFDLYVDGKRLPGMVRGVGHWFFLRKKRYSLVVGLSELARDTQTLRGWPLAYLATVAVWTVLALAALGAVLGYLVARFWWFHRAW